MYSSTDVVLSRNGVSTGHNLQTPRFDILVRRHQIHSPWTYADADRLQRERADQLAQHQTERGLLILSEFAPTITYGKRTSLNDFTVSKDQIAARGIDLYEVDRGGLATFHGSGQWVIFLVDRIERLARDSRRVSVAVRFLLERAAEVARKFCDRVEIREGEELGVWTDRGKCASVGVRVSRGVLLHGICLNGYRTEKSFYGITPCGLNKPVDFLLSSSDEAAFVALGESIQQAFLSNEAVSGF